MAAYPEGAVGDAGVAPGDSQRMFEGRGRDVGAAVEPVSFRLDLHCHRYSLCILKDKQEDRQMVSLCAFVCMRVCVSEGACVRVSYLSCDGQRSFPSILYINSELGGLVDDAAGLL